MIGKYDIIMFRLWYNTDWSAVDAVRCFLWPLSSKLNDHSLLVEGALHGLEERSLVTVRIARKKKCLGGFGRHCQNAPNKC